MLQDLVSEKRTLWSYDPNYHYMGSDDAALSVRGKEVLDRVAADLTQPLQG
jgi:hypothetical protein